MDPERRARVVARIRRQRQKTKPPARYTFAGFLRAVLFVALLATMVGVPALIPIAFKAWQTHAHH